MDSAINIAVSGLQAASASIGAVASNIANMRTDGPVPATPPSQPAAPGGVYQAIDTQQTAQTDGGVTAKLTTTLPSYFTAYDPNSPFANSDGVIAQPNVDVAAQFVKMIEAHAAFSANLAVIRTADRTYKSLFDLIA